MKEAIATGGVVDATLDGLAIGTRVVVLSVCVVDTDGLRSTEDCVVVEMAELLRLTALL